SPASAPPAGAVSLPGTITEVIYLGTSTRILVELESGKRLTVLEQNASSRSSLDRRGEQVHVRFASADLVFLEPVAA
ncbi:MAG: TOBE domain-containing protein, partial [Rhodoglobus sp.]